MRLEPGGTSNECSRIPWDQGPDWQEENEADRSDDSMGNNHLICAGERNTARRTPGTRWIGTPVEPLGQVKHEISFVDVLDKRSIGGC